MNKRLLNNLLYGALLLSVGTSVFSCKDYDDDIAGLDNRISTVESDMERFKEKIQAALDANLTVASWYPSDDFSQYTIVLSNGDELRLQASGQSTPFYQFKIEDGVWKYSSDKGAGWYNVKTQGTEQDIPGTDKDIFFYDYETGFIFINKSESEATKTNISITKDAPIMALNTENKTLSIYHFTARTTFSRYKAAGSAASALFYSGNSMFSKKIIFWKQPAIRILPVKSSQQTRLLPNSGFYPKT